MLLQVVLIQLQLKGHILGAGEILKAAKAGNTTEAAAAEKKWYGNADEIATFLSAANPNWSKADLKIMLDNHLNLTLSEAVGTLGSKYSDSIIAFDKVLSAAGNGYVRFAGRWNSKTTP